MTVAISFRTSRAARDALYRQFEGRIALNPKLDRQLVSYQADKETPFYRWFKYREGFTSRLVQYLLEEIRPGPGVLLDPFAGSGSALFSSATLGWRSCGIEVLPVGVYAMEARKAASRVDTYLFASIVNHLKHLDFAPWYDEEYALKHIPITRGAFPLDTERELVSYIAYCNTQIEDKDARKLALYASFCILEDISYTRKDGQYLRWDYRCGRSQGMRPFDKGRILSFGEAISAKLDQMAWDLTGQRTRTTGQLALDFGENQGCPITTYAYEPQILQGSCLDILPTVPSASIDTFLTSPPYANRYDYTRTYALELVYLGATREDVIRLRQNMLSCTVENRAKRAYMENLYRTLHRAADFERVEIAFQSQQALQEVLSILDEKRVRNELNNSNIVSLVRNYFYEMCFVIYEMARILSPGGYVIMVNDNVRYAGEEVHVDLILSGMAEQFGLVTDKIWTLSRGKGNSSQQMGIHGRSELRKCIYIWRRP